jgi:hypothetical protein
VWQNPVAEAVQGEDKQKKAARFILASKLFSAKYAQDFDLRSVDFFDEVHKVIAEYVAEKESLSEPIRPSGLFEIFDEDCAEFNKILDLNKEDGFTGEIAERFFRDSVNTLQREHFERQLSLYKSEYETETDVEKRKELAKKISECMAKKKKLR